MIAADLFAGLGGFTQGAEMAGVRVVWVANHWRLACDFHQQNHPAVVPVCQDLRQADWRDMPQVDLLLASPSCKGHTHARGKDQPHHDDERATAWAVVDCAEARRPDRILVENVPAFLRWVLFPAWKQALEALGYALSWQVLDAADFGVPQNRERVFILATRGKAPLQWKLKRHEHLPASGLIDWSEGRWSRVLSRGRATRTRLCYRNGREQHGERFLIPYYKTARTGRSLARPLGTVTTVARFAVVDGDRMRMLTVPEYRRAMGFADGTALPQITRLAIHLLGNAVPPPMARAVIEAIQ